MTSVFGELIACLLLIAIVLGGAIAIAEAYNLD
jgi:hypothetical protein